jgi:hypothetical protein
MQAWQLLRLKNDSLFKGATCYFGGLLKGNQLYGKIDIHLFDCFLSILPCLCSRVENRPILFFEFGGVGWGVGGPYLLLHLLTILMLR